MTFLVYLLLSFLRVLMSAKLSDMFRPLGDLSTVLLDGRLQRLYGKTVIRWVVLGITGLLVLYSKGI